MLERPWPLFPGPSSSNRCFLEALIPVRKHLVEGANVLFMIIKMLQGTFARCSRVGCGTGVSKS